MPPVLLIRWDNDYSSGQRRLVVLLLLLLQVSADDARNVPCRVVIAAIV